MSIFSISLNVDGLVKYFNKSYVFRLYVYYLL